MKHLIAAGALSVLALACALPPAAEAQPRAAGAQAMPKVTIYHIEGRRSERIVWLMEELGLPYELVFKKGDIMGSMAAIRAVNPGMPVAPTVTYGDQVLTESGAIIELILDRHGRGRLAPPVGSRDYPAHLMWMHHAEGSLAARVIGDYRVWMIQPPTARSPLVDSEAEVQFAEDFLATHPYFGGAEFSAADIMMLFPLNFALELNIVDKTRFPRVNAWREKVQARPAYQRMVAKARPGGIPGSPRPLPKHAPPGPRTPAPAPR